MNQLHPQPQNYHRVTPQPPLMPLFIIHHSTSNATIASALNLLMATQKGGEVLNLTSTTLTLVRMQYTDLASYQKILTLYDSSSLSTML